MSKNRFLDIRYHSPDKKKISSTHLFSTYKGSLRDHHRRSFSACHRSSLRDYNRGNGRKCLTGKLYRTIGVQGKSRRKNRKCSIENLYRTNKNNSGPGKTTSDPRTLGHLIGFDERHCGDRVCFSDRNIHISAGNIRKEGNKHQLKGATRPIQDLQRRYCSLRRLKKCFFPTYPGDPSTTVRESTSTTSGQQSVTGYLWIPEATRSVELPSTVIDSASDREDKKTAATKEQCPQRRSPTRLGTRPEIGRATIIQRAPPTEGVFTTERERLQMAGEQNSRVPPEGTPYVPSPVERVMAALPERFEQDNGRADDENSDTDNGCCIYSFWLLLGTAIFIIVSAIVILMYEPFRFKK